MKPWNEAIRTHLGLIILGICILIGSSMIFVALKWNRPMHGYQPKDHVELTAGLSGTSHQLGITTNGGDVTYHSEITVGKGKKLNVISSDSKSIVFEGTDISAKFYHVSRLLVVRYTKNDDLQVTYFNNPISCNVAD